MIIITLPVDGIPIDELHGLDPKVRENFYRLCMSENQKGKPMTDNETPKEPMYCPLYTTFCDYAVDHTNKIVDVTKLELIAEHYKDSDAFWCYMKLYYSKRLMQFIEVQFDKMTNIPKSARTQSKEEVIPIIVNHCDLSIMERFRLRLGIEDLS